MAGQCVGSSLRLGIGVTGDQVDNTSDDLGSLDKNACTGYGLIRAREVATGIGPATTWTAHGYGRWPQ
ncbi:MAG: hypothetical protein H5T86_09815 [Armatimonadetes bacterium]|nr:hypothetical protein [Armatimonadota bacterium]